MLNLQEGVFVKECQGYSILFLKYNLDWIQTPYLKTPGHSCHRKSEYPKLDEGYFLLELFQKLYIALLDNT